MTSVWLLVFPLFFFTMSQTLYVSSNQKTWIQQAKDWSDHYKNLEIIKGKQNWEKKKHLMSLDSGLEGRRDV